ncbi:opsin-5-like [Mizuhopecten yessoensis]|uniref:opsin-5-like n=1 Tax=Mizuhopecten yessoensis TaxID=6573 RepID=UPI000B45A923|nr:opsin-5-like [Mizuhopecten yessoensis]
MDIPCLCTGIPLYEDYYVNDSKLALNTSIDVAHIHKKDVMDLSIFYSKLSPVEDTLVALYLGVVGATSIFLNAMVLFVCFKKRRTLKSIDYYIVNLAITDLFLPLFGFPLVVTSSLQHEWQFGVYGCYVYGFLGFFCGTVSISTLAMMSFVRYMSVCEMQKSVHLTKHTSVLVFFTYVYACIWSIPPFLGWGNYGVEPHGTSCTLNWSGSRSFVTVMLIMCIILPVVIMTFCYGRVLLFLKRSTDNLNKWTPHRPNRKHANRKLERSLIKLTFTMCVAFVGTWTPYAVFSLWTAYGNKEEIPIRLTLSSILIAKLSTIINPTIYFVLNRKFRPFIKRYLSMPFHGILNLIGDKSSTSG